MKHWRPDLGNVVPLRAFGRRRGWKRSSILLCAVLIASIAAYHWPTAKALDTARRAPIVIDTQTADVVDDADLEWEQRAYDGPEEPPPSPADAPETNPAQ